MTVHHVMIGLCHHHMVVMVVVDTVVVMVDTVVAVVDAVDVEDVEDAAAEIINHPLDQEMILEVVTEEDLIGIGTDHNQILNLEEPTESMKTQFSSVIYHTTVNGGN